MRDGLTGYPPKLAAFEYPFLRIWTSGRSPIWHHTPRTMPLPKNAAPRRKRHHCGEKGVRRGDCVRRMNHTGRTRIAVENLFTTPHPVRNLTC
jgi:hypothetical protein